MVFILFVEQKIISIRSWMLYNIDYGVQIICFANPIRDFYWWKIERIQWNFIECYLLTILTIFGFELNSRLHCTWHELFVGCQMCRVFEFTHFRLNYYFMWQTSTTSALHQKPIESGFIWNRINTHMPHAAYVSFIHLLIAKC